MAYPENLRSLVESLRTGAIDGSYKQLVKDRGGVVEDTTVYARADLSVRLYGIVETPDKQMPDGSGVVHSETEVNAPLAVIDRRNG